MTEIKLFSDFNSSTRMHFFFFFMPISNVPDMQNKEKYNEVKENREMKENIICNVIGYNQNVVKFTETESEIPERWVAQRCQNTGKYRINETIGNGNPTKLYICIEYHKAERKETATLPQSLSPSVSLSRPSF